MTTFIAQFKVGVVMLLLGTSLLASAPLAQAATFSAVPVSISGNGTLSMKPGEVKEVTAVVQNTSDVTWKNDGPGYISLYTYEPKYRVSQFDPGTWLSGTQVKRIKESSVASGKTATLVFQLKAPATVGDYVEVFQLASESVAWVDGGKLKIKINVAEAAPSSSPINGGETAVINNVNPTDGYSASLAVRSANKIKSKAGKSVLFSASFKNTGTKTWKNYGLKAPDVAIASNDASVFSNSTWTGSQLALATGSIKPGELATVSFSFTAPKTNGSHTAKFQLTADDLDVPGAFIEIPVTVTDGAKEAITAPKNENAEAVDESKMITEPTIRVGTMIVDEETENKVVITSNESDWQLQDLIGKVLSEMKKGEEVEAYYEDGKYYYVIDGDKAKSSSALRFVPNTTNAVMTVTNFDRRVTRGTANADNTFRNILELRYNDYKDRAWLINELAIEPYLKGLAETSNVSPIEFQKTLLTAARTYAFYHWTRATKHEKEFFHVDAYADQVYNGYGQEARTPRLSQGVDETRGQIVTYQGEIAITPYFSRSDGHTRNWSDVWYGEVPWAVSVKVPCDNGKVLWGHGVGMSASGALCMANQGQTWDQILKYFYTGITIEKRWK